MDDADDIENRDPEVLAWAARLFGDDVRVRDYRSGKDGLPRGPKATDVYRMTREVLTKDGRLIARWFMMSEEALADAEAAEERQHGVRPD